MRWIGLILGSALPASALAAPYGASLGGVCTGIDYNTFQEAVNAGDVVFVAGSPIEVDETLVSRNTTVVPSTTEMDAANCMTGGHASIVASSQSHRVVRVEAVVALTVGGVDLTHDTTNPPASPPTHNGGTIYLEPNSRLQLANMAVTNGSVDGRGGCIYGEEATIYMNETASVESCTATEEGGGIALFLDGGDVSELQNIENNTSSMNGGGVWTFEAWAVICGLVSNVAEQNGGGLYHSTQENSAPVLIDLQTQGNQATLDGGGAYVTGALSTLYAHGEVHENFAEGNGGGLRGADGAGIRLVPGLIVEDNDTPGDGGGVHADSNAHVLLSDLLVERPPDTADVLVGEEVIFVGSSPVDGFSCVIPPVGPITVRGNRAGYDATGTSANTTSNGGGFYLENSSLAVEVDQQHALDADSNIATLSGGGLHANTSTVELKDVGMDLNVAETAHGGAFHTDGASTTVTFGPLRAEFDGNTSAQAGGAAAVVRGTVTLSEAQITNNAAGILGGGLATQFGTATLLDTVFTANQADARGGAIGVAGGSVTGERLSIRDNGALRGGGFSAGDGTFTLTDSVVQANGLPTGVLASNLGGGGYVVLNGAVTVTDTDFIGNQSTRLGGGVHVFGGTLTVTGGAFTTNRSDSGAGMFISPNGEATVTNVVFNANQARVLGGGVATKGRAAFDDVDLTSNLAPTGGGVHVSGQGDFTLATGLLDGNSAQDAGGAITVAEGTLQLGDPQGTGSACSADAPCVSVLNNTTSAVASQGGGLAVLGGTASLDRVEFNANTTAANGDAIMQSGGSLAMTNLVVHDNGVTAAILAAGGTLTCDHCTVSQNTGTGLEINGGDTTFDRSLYAENGTDLSLIAGTVTGDCNVLQTSAASFPAGSIDSVLIEVSDVSTSLGEPLTDAASWQDVCTTGLGVDIHGASRPLGTSFDRGAFEL